MILYHYTSGEALLKILECSTIHLSNIKYLNDHSEEEYFIDLLENAAKSDDKLFKIHDALFYKDLFNGVNSLSERYIISFSEEKDSLSLWNNYASGNGFNLGFDKNELFKICKNNEGYELIKIIYDEKVQIKMICPYIFKSEDLYLELKQIESDVSLNSEKKELDLINIKLDYILGLYEYFVKFKHSAFKSEKEYRLRKEFYLPDINKEIFYKVSKNGVIVNYINAKFDIKKAINEINAHPLASSLHSKGIEFYFKSKLGIENFKVAISNIPYRIV